LTPFFLALDGGRVVFEEDIAGEEIKDVGEL
jgi:hypothetical protein